MNSKDKLDAIRYRWLRRKYAQGDETYLAEGISDEIQLDEYIDMAMLSRDENEEKSKH